MNEPGLRRTLPDQFSGSGHTFGTPRHPSVTSPILSKRVCFYKSGDPQFNGLRMVINNRTFKTFDALLDSLSKKVPLPFGVRNITTPRGVHAVYSLDELEDGKSYICSDSRKVKPINLAVARKKPPPWYHARPVSSRRRTIQQARLYPGHKLPKQESVVMRTPKKLLVYRNGDPSVKCIVVLQKRTTPTFESILRYISELMQFSVAKLHTPEGRRVDGLPGLIMCSGTVVAAGREKFKPANYNSQKAVGPTWMRSNRMGLRRLKALNRKKMSYALKPRILSPSSERYIVSQIHNSIAESSYTNPTNSIEMESSRILESVAESEAEHFPEDGSESQDCMLPTDDDIEKSFRVNQDGSMTVEMKVRLTIKEEETIHWTTTLSRSGVPNQFNEDCLLAPEQEIILAESVPVDLHPLTATSNAINKNKDDYVKDPPSLSNGVYSKGGFEKDNIKALADFVSHFRTPIPEQKQIQTKQASIELIKSLTADGLQEDIVGSNSYREHIQNGDLTEQYCMLEQTCSRPVPKPRRVGSLDANNHNISTYRSAGMTEILQVESSGDEVTETVMHIYEQQTCQDNFLANFCVQCMPTSAIHVCRPATSEMGLHSSNSNFEAGPCRPSTASESVSIWNSETISLKSDVTFPSQNTGPTHTHTQPSSQELTISQNKAKPKAVKKEKRVYPKHKAMIKWLKSPGNKQKEGKSKKVKPFTSAKFISKIYGDNSKSPKDTIKLKKRQIEGAKAKGSHQADEKKIGLSTSEPRGMLTWQTSIHQESQNHSFSVTESMPPSNSGTNGYVVDWLEKALSKPPSYPEEESNTQKDSEKINLQNDPCMMSVTEKVKCLKEKSKNQNSGTALPLELSRTGSVRQRIKSFENKSAEDKSPPDTNPGKSSLLKKSKERTSISNGICYRMNLKELPSDIENTSSIIVQFEETSNSLLMDPPSQPHAESLPELSTVVHGMDASAASSPLYRLSSVSDIHPLSTSPTSDKAISPTDHTMEMVSSIQADNPSELREAPLQRAPSIKRAPLVSNLSLERKMSLKKAALDKYTIPSDTTSLPINTAVDNALSKSTDTAPVERLQSKSPYNLESSQYYCSSASPASLTSDQKTTSTSVHSSEASWTMEKSNEEYSSPKPLAKKVKLVESPSLERKHQTKKPSSEVIKSSSRLPLLNNHPADKNASPNVIRKKNTTPSASPATEKRQIHKSKLLNKPSPYSQSLDLASPPVKQKTSKKSLHRNLSTDSALENSNKTPRKLSSQKRSEKTPQSTQSTKSIQDEKVQIHIAFRALGSDPRNDAATMDDFTKVDKEKDTDVIPQPLTNQPNIKPLLEKLCYSIKSIRQITQNKHHSCLETSISLPDFSSHVASTFGSSSKALLAFLSVMTLKERMPKLDVDGLNANNVSCAEALKMIDSLREISSIEESQKLQNCLSHLKQSASQQLLQSWRGFQELSEKCKSQSSFPWTVEQDCSGTSPEKVEENVIDEIMDNLEMPEVLREELASFSIRSYSNNEQSKKGIEIHKNIFDITQETQGIEGTQLQNIYIESSPGNYEVTVNESMSGAKDFVEQKHSVSQLNISQKQQKVEHQIAILENQESETEEILDTHCYVELTVSKPESTSSPESDSELARASNSEAELQMYLRGMEVKCSVETITTDEDKEEEQQDASKELKIIIEEPLSEVQEAGVGLIIKDQSKLTENELKINLEDDSGNNHNSWEECIDINSTNNEKQIMASNEEELNYNEKEINSAEETTVVDRFIKESYHQTNLSEDEKIENIAKKLCDEVISQSVAEQVTCLEKKVNGHRRSSGIVSSSHEKKYFVSDGEKSSPESPTSQLTPCIHSAPQSSLSFSYDSSSVITKQPEGNRVRSIREMFLAKSASDNQQSQKQNSSPNSCEITELRSETSISGGYQSQTSSELSSGEDDSSRKSITKGFVMRTIERLYGTKESAAQVDKSDRPPSPHKHKKKDQTSMFSPFHATRSKVVSELSYFNSSNALDTLSEATQCIAFHAQVGPGDSVPIDDGRWLLQDSTVLRKSVSEPVAINKNLVSAAQEEQNPCKDRVEKTPYLLFKTDSEDDQKALSKKCTYFSLPHASDSEAVQEETVGKSGINHDGPGDLKNNPEGTKIRADKNGKLPGVVVTDFKIMDNKVHPLVEVPPAGEAVVVQPVRGQDVINRRLQEPDMLDILYNFCGDHCPIL